MNIDRSIIKVRQNICWTVKAVGEGQILLHDMAYAGPGGRGWESEVWLQPTRNLGARRGRSLNVNKVKTKCRFTWAYAK
jgi:hypothetical protein